MAEATVSVLYRETAGCGSDSESNEADGVEVILTEWGSGEEWRAKDHFIIQTIVLLDREMIVDSREVFYEPVFVHYCESKMIRRAIEKFDQAVKAHPSSEKLMRQDNDK